MTLLGCVPEEILAETGSNVKSAVESGTEQESLKKRLDVLGKKGALVTAFSSHLTMAPSVDWFNIQKQIC